MRFCGGADKYMTQSNVQSHRHSYTTARMLGMVKPWPWVVNKGSYRGQAFLRVGCQCVRCQSSVRIKHKYVQTLNTEVSILE